MRRFETQRAGLGRELVAEVERTLAKIENNPQSGAPYVAEFRFLMTRRFPYIVYFVETADWIWIPAVAHAKRRPGYWRRRRVE